MGRGTGSRTRNILVTVFGDDVREAISAEKVRVGRDLLRVVKPLSDQPPKVRPALQDIARGLSEESLED